VQDPQNKIIDQASKTLIDKLLLEKIPLAGIAKVVGVSEPWLQSDVSEKYQNMPRQVDVNHLYFKEFHHACITSIS